MVLFYYTHSPFSFNFDLKYAAYDGSTWHIETVDTEGNAGSSSSLALDPITGYPRISYGDTYTNDDLRYAAYDGSTWHIETIDSEGNVGDYTSLALDSTTGYPRISYVKNDDLMYAAYDGSTWNIETVDSKGNIGDYTSLALDPKTGYPRISYYEETNDYLKYAAYDGSTWHIETVDFVGRFGWINSLALDPKTGYPRISYCNTTYLEDLKYAAYDGSTWHIETVDSKGNAGVGAVNSLALDPNTGYLRISYSEGNYRLWYASYDGSTWNIEIVDSEGKVRLSNSLALDPNTGYPRISYFDYEDNFDLKYASFMPSDPSIPGNPMLPIANFTSNVTQGFAPLTVQFTDLSENATGWNWSFGDGQTSTVQNPSHTYSTPGTYTVSLNVSNADGYNISTKPDLITVNPTVPPIITAIMVPVDPVPVNEEISISGTFTDPDTVDTHTAVWDWGDSTTSDGIVTEAGGSGTVNGTHTYTTPGIYPITLTVTDSSGASDTETAETYIVIYDPTGGFVTGGGWFNSLSEAYEGNPTLTGKVDFEFVSKYQKGATIPKGNAQFKFKEANLRFESTGYKWLIVSNAGMNAQLFGQGTINDSLAPNNEEYKFMIWATDGNPDALRIKIWWEDNSVENIVYDNNAQQLIGGGAIQVHA